MISLALVFAATLGLIFVPYVLHHLFLGLFKGRDLKKRYDAQWALVTGASSGALAALWLCPTSPETTTRCFEYAYTKLLASAQGLRYARRAQMAQIDAVGAMRRCTGIGKSIAKKLALQGLNVVLVALQDALLDGTTEELAAAFPAVQIRKVGVNLGKPGYLVEVQQKTQDIDVQIVFCNAGYMLTGFFDSMPLEAQMANLECNAVSAVQITHHFLAQMKQKGLRGCFVYTSSAAAAIVSPFTVLYAATKSFVSSFGASLAAEVKELGIDVLVFHPSPVATRFYDKAHKLDMLDFFKNFAVSPDELPDVVFASIGRTVWRDIGATAVGFRLMMKVVDYNSLSTLLSFIGQFMPDFKVQRAASRARECKQT